MSTTTAPRRAFDALIAQYGPGFGGDDSELMQRAGVDLVTVGVFSEVRARTERRTW